MMCTVFKLEPIAKTNTPILNKSISGTTFRGGVVYENAAENVGHFHIRFRCNLNIE